MTFFLHDLAGLLLGTLIAPAVYLLPGFALLGLLERAGLTVESPWRRAGLATIAALSVFPAVDALLVRWMGLPGMIAVHAALLLAALPALARRRYAISAKLAALLLLWWLIVAACYVDFDWDGRLYQSLLGIDLVKHAAVIEAIVRDGLPLNDPFFARNEAAGYYYYYYLWSAAVRWIGAGTVNARMAFAATLFWTGPILPALLWRIAAGAGLIRLGREHRFLLICVVLCFVTGADLVAMLGRYAAIGVIEPQVDWWNEEVRFAMTSLIWVPHHVAALIACWAGMLLLERAGRAERRLRWLLLLSAGLAFASTFGMSAWIAVTAAPVLAVWSLVEYRCGRSDLLRGLIVAGAVAMVFALPQFVDIAHGRAPEGFPIGLWVRRFAILFPDARPWAPIALIALLPLNYLLEFGIFALGSELYWRSRPKRDAGNSLRRLLIVAAVTALVIASFLRSTIINNDFGWRSIWFAQLPAMLWTAAAVQSMPRLIRPTFAFRLLLLLGLAGNLWDVIGLRVIRPPLFPTPWPEINAAPANDFSQRRAYEWAGSHLPADAVLQHNAALQHRLLAFGLYGRQRTGVADREAMLFGADRSAVARRIAAIRPLFEQALPPDQVTRIAHSQGVDYLVITDLDPVWRRSGGPPAALDCRYRDLHVCIAAAFPRRKEKQ